MVSTDGLKALRNRIGSFSEKFLNALWVKFPSDWKDRLEQKVKKELKNQYVESEEWFQKEAEQFFLKQGKILLAEAVIVIFLIIVLILGTVFTSRDIILKRNLFGEGTKEVLISLKEKKRQKNITYKLREQELSSVQISQIYNRFFRQLKKKMTGKNSGLDKVTTALNLPDSIDGYPFEITYEFLEDGYIWLDGTLNEKEQSKLGKGESYKTTITVKASYRKYEQSRKYTIRIFSEEDVEQHGLFYKAEQYLKKKEAQSRYKDEVKLPDSYGKVRIETDENGAGSWGVLLLVLSIGLFIPVHNYLKLRETGEKCQAEAERDFHIIVHLLTLYMGAGLSFFSAVRRIGRSYQKQKDRDGQKKYAFERILLMEQQMNNGVSQREACYNWGMQFKTGSYQKLSLILIQSFTKGARDAAMLMEAEEREAFSKRIDKAKKEGEEASTRLLFPMILLLGEVMLLVMYPALIRFQGI